MYIQKAATFITRPKTEINTLRNELLKYSDKYFRRVNNFIMLSLLGIYKCLDNSIIAKDTAVYLTSAKGNLGDTENILSKLFINNEFPNPYNFINTMSNTSAFQIAQSLNLLSTNISISDNLFSFERGAELLKMDFLCNRVDKALIGAVDETFFLKADIVKHLGLNDFNAKLIDSAAWCHITKTPESPIGEIKGIYSFKSIEEARKASICISSKCSINFGVLIGEEEKIFWKKHYKTEDELNYIARLGYSDSFSGLGICKFLEESQSSILININKNNSGNYIFTIVEKY